MQRRIPRFLLLILLVSGQVFSQADSEHITIRGIITDSSNGKLLPNATVTILQREKVAGRIFSTQDGMFSLTIPFAGTYRMEVSYVGYKTWVHQLRLVKDRQEMTVDTVKLAIIQDNMHHVTVKASKPVFETSVGITTYNVSVDPMANGKPALEVLENLPGVSTDPTGRVMVNGVSEIVVMINRKISRMSYSDVLKQMPASAIERIELINGVHPRYAASGAEYVINLVTKRERSKEGSIAVSTGSNTMSSAMLMYSYGNRKYNLYTRAGYNFHSMPNLGAYTRSDMITGVHLFQRTGVNDINHKMANIVTGVDFTLDSNRQLSIEYGRNIHSDRFEGKSAYSVYNTTGNINNYFSNTVQTSPKETENNISINYQEKITRFTTLESELYYSTFRQQSTRLSPLVSDMMVSSLHSNNLNANVEVQSRIKKMQLVTGVSVRNVGLRNTWHTDRSGTVSDSRLENNIFSAGVYGLLTFNFKKGSLAIGMRFEHLGLTAMETAIPMRNSSFHNLSVYPSLFFRKPVSHSVNLSFSANRKIIYPEVHFAFNSPSQADEFDFMQGNAALRPAIATRLQADMTVRKKRNTLTISTFFMHTDHVFARLQSYENQVKTDRFVNFNYRSSYGISGNLNIPFSKWLQTRLISSSTFNYFDTDPGYWIKFRKTFNVSGSLTNLFTFSKKLGFENSFRLLNVFRSNYSTTTAILNINAQLNYKPLGNDKLIVNLFVHDLLNVMRFQSANYLNNRIIQEGFEASRYNRFIRLNLSYKFGGGVKTREKKIVSEKVSYIQ